MCPPWRVSELMAPLASISSARAPSSAFRVTAYGALAGGLAGACVSVVVTLVYAYAATRGVSDSVDRALAGTMLLSGVLGFPLSVPLMTALSTVVAHSSLVTAVTLLMPFINWLVLGVAAGAMVDLVRGLLSARRR